MRRGLLVILVLASLFSSRVATAGPYDVILADGADITLCLGCGITLAGLDYGLLVNTGTSDITLADLTSARFSVTSSQPAIVLYPFINIPNPQIVGDVHPGEAIGSIIQGNELLLDFIRPGETLRNLAGMQFMAYQVDRPGSDPYEGPVDFDVIMTLAGYVAHFTIHAQVHLGQHAISFTHATRVSASPGDTSTIDCRLAAASPATLWPPNHRLVPIDITGVVSSSGSPMSITATAVTQDEQPARIDSITASDVLPSEGLVSSGAESEPVDESLTGSLRRGHPAAGLRTCPDAVIENGRAFLRAERSPQGNGRVYVITFTAQESNGSQCSGTVAVCVPRNPSGQGQCLDDGQAFNSLERCTPSRGPGRIPQNVRLIVPTVTRGVVVFAYTLEEPAELDLELFDVAGRRVATLERGLRTAGDHSVSWSPGSAPHGVYFVRARTGQQVTTRQVVLANR